MKEDGERDPSGDKADGAAVLPPPTSDVLPAPDEGEPAPPDTPPAAAELPALPPTEPGPDTAVPEADAPARPPPSPIAHAASPHAPLPGRGADLAAFVASRLGSTLLTLSLAVGLLWLALPVDALPELSLLAEGLAVTLPLMGLALLVALVIGGACGLARLFLGRATGWVIGALGLLTTGLSPLLLALGLVLVVAGVLGWLPPGGFVPWQQDVAGAFASLTLPALALGLPLALLAAQALADAAAPILARGEIERGAETGLTRRRALWQLVLPEALPDALARLFVPLSLLPPLTLVVEAVFYLPGLSRSVLGPIAARDAGGLLAGLATVAGLVVLCRLALELCRGLLDPRLTDQK